MMKTNNIPGVIQLIDYFELPDCFMIVMERIGAPGTCKDLFDFISDFGPIKEDLARVIFKQIITTVIQVHKAGVVHRDIKDENILIDTRTYKVKLIDFGSGAKLHNEIYSDFDGTIIFKLDFFILNHPYSFLLSINDWDQIKMFSTGKIEMWQKFLALNSLSSHSNEPNLQQKLFGWLTVVKIIHAGKTLDRNHFEIIKHGFDLKMI